MRRTVVGAIALLGACSFEHGALQGDNFTGDANGAQRVHELVNEVPALALRSIVVWLTILPPEMVTQSSCADAGTARTPDPTTDNAIAEPRAMCDSFT